MSTWQARNRRLVPYLNPNHHQIPEQILCFGDKSRRTHRAMLAHVLTIVGMTHSLHESVTAPAYPQTHSCLLVNTPISDIRFPSSLKPRRRLTVHTRDGHVLTPREECRWLFGRHLDRISETKTDGASTSHIMHVPAVRHLPHPRRNR